MTIGKLKINAKAYGVVCNDKNLHREYWNVASKISIVNIVFSLCNDTKLLTPNYYSMLIDSLRSFKEKINTTSVLS